MANYTAVAAGGDWNVSTTWSPVGVPTALDTAILNSASGNVTVPALGSNCVTLTLTGYTGTLLLNGNLTIATSGLNLGSFTGTINFNAGDIILPDGLFNLGNASIYTTLGTGGVRITKPSASFSIFNTNNKIWNCKFALGAAGSTSPTIYFEDNPLEVTGLVSFQATTTGTINLISADIFTPNLVFLKMSGNFTISGSTIYTTTTSGQNIGITGSSNQTLTASGTHQLRCPLRIDKTGGVLTLSGTINYNTGTLTYVASGGTVNAGSSTLNIGASTTLNTNGITWSNISAGLTFSNPTITLSSNLTWSGTMSLINNTLGVSGATRTVTFSGSSLTSLPTANIDIGNTGFASFGGASIINFPSSTVLSITNLNIGCGGFSSGAYNTSANNVTFNISGNLTLNTSNGAGAAPRFNGTSSQINIIGNSTITNNRIGGTSTYVAIPTFTINTPNTVTFSSNDANTFYFESSTITYTSGTLTGATCVFITSTLNLNTGGKWGTDVVLRGNTILTSNATFGNLTTNTNNVGLTGAFTINVEGNLAINVATGGASTPIVINGTGSQSWTHAGAVYLSSNLTINKASGTLTIGTLALPNVYYQTGTLTYNNIGGIVDAITNNSRLISGASTTFATDGIIWNNATFSGNTPTFTLTNNLTLSGTLTLSGQVGTNTTISGGDLNVGGLSVTTTSNIVGSSILNFTGTGTWNHTAAGYIVKNININTSGTLTLGANIYYSVNTITYISGTVDSSTNSSTLIIFLSNINGWFTLNLDTVGMSWYNIVLTSSGGGTRTVTLTSDLSILNDFALTNGSIASTTTFVGNGSITCNALQPQPGSGNAFTLNFNNTNIYTNDLLTNTFTAGTSTTMNSANLYISRNIRIGNSNLLASFGGTVQIYYVGTGTWTTNQTVANQSISASFTINTSGVLTISRNVYFAGANTFTYRNGKVNTKNSTLNITGNSTFVNCNKINFDSVVITAGNTITMNEFFNGSPELQTAVSSTTTTNAIITFTDNFEKIAKFVNINGVTFTRPQQLLLLTNQPKKSRNIGIRYNNQSPNGISKGDPSVQNQMAYSTSKFLVGDPSMIKTI